MPRCPRIDARVQWLGGLYAKACWEKNGHDEGGGEEVGCEEVGREEVAREKTTRQRSGPH